MGKPSKLQEFIKTKREEQNLDKNLKKSLKMTPPREKISGEEYVEIVRIPCQHCSRKFYPKKTLEKHQKQCLKDEIKREQFNSQRQRLTEDLMEVTIKKETEDMKYKEIERKQCKYCPRMFDVKRLLKHQNICQKQKQKGRREKFNSQIQRVTTQVALKKEGKDGREACKYCGRKFDMNRIQRHQNICEKAITKKRMIYNSQQKRLSDLLNLKSTSVKTKNYEDRAVKPREDLYQLLSEELDYEKTMIILNNYRYHMFENMKQLKQVLQWLKEYIEKTKMNIDMEWIGKGYLQSEYLMDSLLEILNLYAENQQKNSRSLTYLVQTLLNGKVYMERKAHLQKYQDLLWKIYQSSMEKEKIENLLLQKMSGLKMKSYKIETELMLLQKIIKTYGFKSMKNQVKAIKVLSLAYDKGTRDEKDLTQDIFQEIYDKIGKVVYLYVKKYGNEVLKRLKIYEEEVKEERKMKEKEYKQELKDLKKKKKKQDKPLQQKQKMEKMMKEEKNVFTYEPKMAAKLIKETYAMYIIKDDSTLLDKLTKDVQGMKDKNKISTLWEETTKMLENPNQLIVIQTLKAITYLVESLKETLKDHMSQALFDRLFELYRDENMPYVMKTLLAVNKYGLIPFKQFQYNFLNLQDKHNLKEQEQIMLYKLMQAIYTKRGRELDHKIMKEDVGMFQTVLYQKHKYDSSSTLKANQLNLIALMVFYLQKSKEVKEMVTMTLKDLERKLIDKNVNKIALKEYYNIKKSKKGDMDKAMGMWKDNLKDFNLNIKITSS